MQQQQQVEHHHHDFQSPGVVPIHNDQEGDRLGRQGRQEPHHRPHAYEVPEGLSPGKTLFFGYVEDNSKRTLWSLFQTKQSINSILTRAD